MQLAQNDFFQLQPALMKINFYTLNASLIKYLYIIFPVC